MYQDGIVTECRKQGDLTFREQGSRAQHDLTGKYVFTKTSNIRTGGNWLVDRDDTLPAISPLYLDHCICTFGDRCAGHDAHRYPGLHHLGCHESSRHIVDHTESDWLLATGPCQVCGNDRIAVHRRVVETRQRVGRVDVGCQHAATGTLRLY